MMAMCGGTGSGSGGKVCRSGGREKEKEKVRA